jgi:hypothetical protein
MMRTPAGKLFGMLGVLMGAVGRSAEQMAPARAKGSGPQRPIVVTAGTHYGGTPMLGPPPWSKRLKRRRRRARAARQTKTARRRRR